MKLNGKTIYQPQTFNKYGKIHTNRTRNHSLKTFTTDCYTTELKRIQQTKTAIQTVITADSQKITHIFLQTFLEYKKSGNTNNQ